MLKDSPWALDWKLVKKDQLFAIQAKLSLYILLVQVIYSEIIAFKKNNFWKANKMNYPKEYINFENEEVLLSLRDVIQTVALSRSTIYEKIKNNEFPQGVLVGTRGRRWLRSEVQSWIKKCKS